MKAPAAQKGLPARLRAYRRQRSWSQERLAQQLGTSRQAICRWEHGDAIAFPRLVELALYGLRAEHAASLLTDARLGLDT